MVDSGDELTKPIVYRYSIWVLRGRIYLQLERAPVSIYVKSCMKSGK